MYRKANGVEFELNEKILSEILYVLNIAVSVYVGKFNEIPCFDYIVITDILKFFGEDLDFRRKRQLIKITFCMCVLDRVVFKELKEGVFI